MQDALSRFALAQARGSFEAGDWAKTLDWLSSVGPAAQPRDLVAKANAFLAREAVAKGLWGVAESHIQRALAARPDPVLAQRLPLVRNASRLLDDAQWSLLREKADAAERLAPDSLRPEITAVYTCEAYHAWRDRYLPWSVFLRIAKEAPRDTEEGLAALHIAGEFLCRVVFEETALLREVDVVAAVPANPARFARRLMSLAGPPTR